MSELVRRAVFQAKAAQAVDDLLDVKALVDDLRTALGAGGMTRAELLTMLSNIDALIDARVAALQAGNNTNRVRNRP